MAKSLGIGDQEEAQVSSDLLNTRATNFDKSFINVTVSVANRDLGLGRKGPCQLFTDTTYEAIKSTRMTLSTKITFRTLLTDGDLPQAYCFDYDDSEAVVVMLVYAQEEDSRLRSEKDPAKLFGRWKTFDPRCS
ncbi:hypothetical protein BGZ93_005153 [Podila epicladia]|nr:hypothetical protein BGZ92_001031 [Podila epicladia]KAG0095971.1 hypothetical protein BGZ93_005153 [Podila epicladia]